MSAGATATATDWIDHICAECRAGGLDVVHAFQSGAGHLRVLIANSAALWDALDSVSGEGGADLVTTGFNELWTVFAGSTGFASASRHFRNMGLFHEIQQSLAGASDWSSIRTAEFQRGPGRGSGTLCR